MRNLLLAALFAALTPTMAVAQSSPALPRADVTGTIGWLNGNKSDLDSESSNDWYNQGLYGGVEAGWYWTEHHKTEVEAGGTNGIDFYVYRQWNVDGLQAWGSSRYTFTLGRVAIGQQYQGLHNAWVHPYAGGGLDLTWERSVERADRVIAFDPRTGASREISPPRTIGPETTLHVRPYLDAGFKAYMTPRAFFRGEMRVLVQKGLDEVLFRCGFGFDF